MGKCTWEKPKYPLLAWMIGICFCCLFFCNPPLLAAGIQVHASLGFGEYVVPGRWTPLCLEVKGGELLQPERLTIEVTKVDPMSKPGEKSSELFYLDISGGILRIQIPVFIVESGNIIQLTIKSDQQVVATKRINSRERVFPGHLVLTGGLPSSVQQAISKILLPREPVHTVPITPADLPTHALNYDGISALLLIDEGPILNPAQIIALRSWLAGGGILVICNPRPGEDGLFSSLTGSTADGLNQIYLNQTNTEQRISSSQSGEGQEELREMIRFGFGRIIKTSLPVNSEEPAYWQDLLSLSHFEEAPRLTAGQIFPEDVLPELNLGEVEAKGKFELRLLIMAWSVLGFSLLYLMKPGKLRLHALCFFTLFSIVSSIPAGGWLNGLAHRGASIQTQALLLPASGGVIFSSKIGLPKNSYAWNLRLQLGAAEEGEINRYKGYSRWQHSLFTYTGLLQTSSERAMTITGILPVAPSSFGGDFWSALSSIVPTGYIGVYDGETWRQYQLDETGQVSWRVQTSDTLAWVSNKDLIKRLHQLFPDYKWVYGWSSLPGFHLKLETGLCNKVFWVTPAPKGVKL